MNNYTNKAFRTTLIITGVIALSILASSLSKDPDIAIARLFFFGLPIFIAILFSFRALYLSIKALNEELSWKTYISLTINSILVIGFLFVIITNAIDLNRALG